MPISTKRMRPTLRSWVASAEGHPDFPIQNLPLGVFAPRRRSSAAASRSATKSWTSQRCGSAALLDGVAQTACEAAAQTRR